MHNRNTRTKALSLPNHICDALDAYTATSGVRLATLATRCFEFCERIGFDRVVRGDVYVSDTEKKAKLIAELKSLLNEEAQP